MLMGTDDSLLEASAFVQTLEKRQGLRIARPEEIAYSRGFITHDDFVRLGKKFEKSTYGHYLLKVRTKMQISGQLDTYTFLISVREDDEPWGIQKPFLGSFRSGAQGGSRPRSLSVARKRR
jgi:hypothetical protein